MQWYDKLFLISIFLFTIGWVGVIIALAGLLGMLNHDR